MTNPDDHQITNASLDVARKLSEENSPLVHQLSKIIRVLGDEFVQNILQETMDIEATGGQLTQDGTRRRTPGGVFLGLVKSKVNPEQRKILFPRPPKTRPIGSKAFRQLAPTLFHQPLGDTLWTGFKLVGRPSEAVRLKDTVFLAFSNANVHLPHPLPLAQSDQTRFVICMTHRAWQLVSRKLNEQTLLKVEGHCVMDRRIGAVLVIARAIGTVAAADFL